MIIKGKLVMQDDIQEGTVRTHSTVVGNEALLLELIHEETES